MPEGSPAARHCLRSGRTPGSRVSAVKAPDATSDRSLGDRLERSPRSQPSEAGAQAAERAATIPPKSAALRLAPPTSAPSTFGTAKISAAFDGFTEPP